MEKNAVFMTYRCEDCGHWMYLMMDQKDKLENHFCIKCGAKNLSFHAASREPSMVMFYHKLEEN